MENKLNNETDKLAEAKTLKQELGEILNKRNMKYEDLERIDEINERLNTLEPADFEYPKDELWEEFLAAANTEGKKSAKPVRRRVSLALAVVLVVALVGIFSSVSVGSKIFHGHKLDTDDEIIIREFEAENTISENGMLTFKTIEDLEAYIGTTLMIPVSIPDKYSLEFIHYNDELNNITISFVLTDNHKKGFDIIITGVVTGKNVYHYFPKDDRETKTFTHNNIEFTIFYNIDETLIMWESNTDSRTYVLGGNIEEEELTELIKSVQ